MKTIDDIIEFVIDWYQINGAISEDEKIAKFVGELQAQISDMDFSLPKGITIIGYGGQSNGTPCYIIAREATEQSDGGATYISKLPAGQLINDERFQSALRELLKDNKKAMNMITSGCDIDWNRVGASSGYGDYVSLDDCVSGKLMGESTGISENLIVFSPEEIARNKVFASTEIEAIFKDDAVKYINGIPKEGLSLLYLTDCTGAMPLTGGHKSQRECNKISN